VDAAATPAPAAAPTPASAAPSNGGWNVTAIPGAADEVPPADEPEPPFEPPEEEPEPIVEAPAPAREPSASGGAAAPLAQGDAPATPAPARPAPTSPRRGQPQAAARYGEAVVRELLGASFIEEQDLAPRDRPVTLDPSAANTPGSAPRDRAE
jgi:DNA polymerase-3 subunit gamma/tau